MKLKKLFLSRLFIVVLLLFSCLVMLIVFYSHTERFQKQQKNTDIMDVVNKFCDKHFGEEWSIDDVSRYNDKITFFVIHTQGSIIDMSVQPENRAIIIENIKGYSTIKNRIYRF